jgi:SPP1 gp7 family putative phage head morphogenesis protein
MGRLPKGLEEKRLRLECAARRGAFESYIRHGRVPEAYERIAAVVNEAKRLDAGASVASLARKLPAGRPTTHYTWRTVGDDRVRDTHAALNGQVFSWADPPAHGHPGTEPNCRCWPEPYYGDPAVPDATLAMVRERSVNRDPGVLWASIDTLTRPDGSVANSSIVMTDGTVIDSAFGRATVDHSVTLADDTVVRFHRDSGVYKLSIDPPDEKPLMVAQLGRLLFPPVPLPPAQAPRAPERTPVTPLDLPTNPWFAAFSAARAISTCCSRNRQAWALVHRTYRSLSTGYGKVRPALRLFW